MKNRMYSHAVSTFFICIVFSMIQMMYLNQMEERMMTGFSGGVMLYHFVIACITALWMECWCYLLPMIYKKSKWIYFILIISCILLWNVPYYVTLFLKLYYVYLVILMAYQLFMIKEANEQLKKIQEQL